MKGVAAPLKRFNTSIWAYILAVRSGRQEVAYRQPSTEPG